MTFLHNTDKDLALALQLQYNEECQSNVEKETANDSRHSIVDRSLEFVDPTPDIYALFREFDRVYFWGKLDCCTLKWSPQMTLCAGVCKYEGRGGLCSIHLSAPLLKLRPRKDLVQTLLHEMIHAYLFVTHNNKDHNAHGPEFVKHMNRINQLSGADITIYHSFHDEVDLYRQHWWQCNGPCRHRPPYYGLLKRSKNRAPGPSDPWWKDHQTSCGGTYIKIKTPEPTKGVKRKLKEEAEPVSKVKTNSNFTPFGGKGNTLGSDKESAPKLNALTKILTKKSDSTANIKENDTTKNKATTEKSPTKLLRQGNLDNYLSASSSKKQLPALPKQPHLSSDNCDIIELDTTQYVKCPICEIRCEQTKINEHLDVCLS